MIPSLGSCQNDGELSCVPQCKRQPRRQAVFILFLNIFSLPFESTEHHGSDTMRGCQYFQTDGNSHRRSKLTMRINTDRFALLTASATLAMMLTGCTTNPYHDYYKATPIPESEKHYLQYLPEEGSPILTASSGDTSSELDEALSHGFIIIGTSNFNAPLIEVEKLAEQAKNVGATHVLYSAKQAGKVIGFAPQAITEAKARTLSEETTRSAKKPSADETANEKTGQSENKDDLFWGIRYLPVSYNNQRFNQSATFLVKSSKMPALGLETQSLTADQKRRLGYNRGVSVKRVFYDSPGFDADLKKGDILYSVNGTVIENQRHFHTIASNYANSGRPMVFEALRGTEPIQITLSPSAAGQRKTPLLIKQPKQPEPDAETSTSGIEKAKSTTADNNTLHTDTLKTPEEKQAEAAERWAIRKKAYDARIQKKQARAKDGFFMGMFHSMTDWFSSDD